ncbi:rubrerythrin [Clostridium fallax]|uniref:Rubrerythrin n=1 Tax=Clostridium fallax TaxID=1533 RepID=A0A1M4VJE9_9CLOT|nr:rubrerythrin family protein [Clostridium fallax]SHE68967.1 Rubrerythrin [Clostridium fallax]SQB22749.1 rubrerythrin [Clostridium fallax]
MKSLIGTETAKNLLKSFAGESQARMRYTYFASTAKKEGYVQISEIFTETANNEKEHAKLFYKYLSLDFDDKGIEICASYPVSLHDSTAKNLKAAAEGEHEEFSVLYPTFAKVAREEGFPEIAHTFEEVAKVENRHEIRYRKLLANIENNKVFKKEENTLWKCLNCGYIYEGTEAPEFCPCCHHPQGYFEVFCENY